MDPWGDGEPYTDPVLGVDELYKDPVDPVVDVDHTSCKKVYIYIYTYILLVRIWKTVWFFYPKD